MFVAARQQTPGAMHTGTTHLQPSLNPQKITDFKISFHLSTVTFNFVSIKTDCLISFVRLVLWLG